MAVVLLKGSLDDEHATVVRGRPDFQNHGFGVTLAKRYPPYVFSIRGVSCLVHKVARVELQWYRVGKSGGSCLVRMKRPVQIAHTVCGFTTWLMGDTSRTCHIPNPDAVLCGRCHGELPSFGKHGAATKAGLKRQVAHVRLGCVVKGY
jgi:hypothetical protein